MAPPSPQVDGLLAEAAAHLVATPRDQAAPEDTPTPRPARTTTAERLDDIDGLLTDVAETARTEHTADSFWWDKVAKQQQLRDTLHEIEALKAELSIR